MASPKITKQGASFPEDPPGTPKLLPGDGGDRSARVQQAREDGTLPDDDTAGLPHARPGEEGERFRSLENPAQDVIRRPDDETGGDEDESAGQGTGTRPVSADEAQVGERTADAPQPEGHDETAAKRERYDGPGWTGETLRGEAAKRGLSTTGTKGELAARLRDHDQDQQNKG